MGTKLPPLGPYRLRDYDLLPNEPRHELVFGRLYVTPTPFTPHEVVAKALGELLAPTADAAGGMVFSEADVVLADHSVVHPDLVYLSAPRLQMVGNRIEGAPDLVIEVLSSGTARFDRSTKRDLYALSGVREYWLVDPDWRQVEFLISEAGGFVWAPLVAARYRSPATPEIELDLSELWHLVHSRLSRLPRWRGGTQLLPL